MSKKTKAELTAIANAAMANDPTMHIKNYAVQVERKFAASVASASSVDTEKLQNAIMDFAKKSFSGVAEFEMEGDYFYVAAGGVGVGDNPTYAGDRNLAEHNAAERIQKLIARGIGRN